MISSTNPAIEFTELSESLDLTVACRVDLACGVLDDILGMAGCIGLLKGLENGDDTDGDTALRNLRRSAAISRCVR